MWMKDPVIQINPVVSLLEPYITPREVDHYQWR